MKNFLFLCIFFLALNINSQTPVLTEEVDLDSELPKYGPNRQNFSQFYISYGVPFGKAEGELMEVNVIKSSYFDLGFRYKYKLLRWNSVGVELAYRYNAYRLKIDSKYDILLHSKDKIKTNSFALGIFDRINFGKTGNYLGTFLDLGVYGEYTYSRNYWYKDKQENGEIFEGLTKKLNSLEKFNYGLFANIGKNKVVVFAKYRLSDLVIDKTKFDEMPRFVAGVQLGI